MTTILTPPPTRDTITNINPPTASRCGLNDTGIYQIRLSPGLTGVMLVILVPILGAAGAAITTATTYALTSLIMLLMLRRHHSPPLPAGVLQAGPAGKSPHGRSHPSGGDDGYRPRLEDSTS